MPSANSITPSFALKVLAPSLVAVTSIALLLLYIVNGIFEETNRLDTTYSEKLTIQAVGTLRDGLENVLYDNAIWDDAAKNAGSASIDNDWIDETWGFASALGVYDTVFVVDDKGNTLYSALDGQRSTTSAADHFGPELDVLLSPHAGRLRRPRCGLWRGEDRRGPEHCCSGPHPMVLGRRHARTADAQYLDPGQAHRWRGARGNRQALRDAGTAFRHPRRVAPQRRGEHRVSVGRGDRAADLEEPQPR